MINILTILYLKFKATIFFLQKIYKTLLSLGKNWILNKIQFYLGKHFTFLLNKYPCLYKATHYLFTTLSIINSYFYIIVLKLHDKFKNKCSIIYYIILYIYSEYIGIIKGNLSLNIGFIITLHVLHDLDNSNLIIFTLLLFNVLFKEYLVKNTWIKINYPRLHNILLNTTSLVNTCLILYFLDNILVKIIMPFMLKLWNSILKMVGGFSDKISNDAPKGNNPKGGPNQNPDRIIVKDKNKEKDKQPTNLSSNSPSNKELLDTELSQLKKAIKDYGNIDTEYYDIRNRVSDFNKYYAEHLSTKDKENCRKLLKTETNVHYPFTSVTDSWKFRKQINKDIWKSLNGVIIAYEVNSKSIQEKLGGKTSGQSIDFRNELNDVKNILSSNYKEKDNFINKQLNHSPITDRIFKKNNVQLEQFASWLVD